MTFSHGIALKKKFGQHFLRDRSVVQRMCARVSLTPSSSILEIGCGDGFLTREILNHPMQRLWVFEIDPEWAQYVRTALPDQRLQIFQQDFLQADVSQFEQYKPWIILANLPYQATFPILHRFQQMRHMISEGVVMVQEEVAQKIMLQGGRGFGYSSLFFQYYFDWHLLEKVPPHSFQPPPKIFSRLIHFKTRSHAVPIADEEHFWRFIKACFKQPRRTLRNNLQQTHYDLTVIDEQTLQLRAQQMSMADLLSVWEHICSSLDSST